MTYCVGCTTCDVAETCPRVAKAALLSRASQKWLGYAGTVLFMFGALAVSASPELSAYPAPFIAFLVGHVIWGAIAYCMHERPLLVMNVLYAVFDLWALWVRT
jgi:hypothetical protein